MRSSRPFRPTARPTVVVVHGYYSRALVVTLILGPIILGLVLGASLKMLEILGR